MKKITPLFQQPTWLTDDMDKVGMTAVVLSYLSGSLKRLKETLTWAEFIFIWSVQGEVFEKTAFFQKHIKLITNPKKEASFKKDLEALSKEKYGERFLMKFLPFAELLSLCNSFWNCFWVFRDRAKTTAEQKEVLKKIRDIATFEILGRDMLLEYLKMTKKADFDITTACVLVSQHLVKHPGDMFVFRDELGKTQIAGFCSVLKGQPTIDIRELFSLYRKTRSEVIPAFFLDVLEKNPEKLNLEYLFESMHDTHYCVARDEERFLSVFQEDWLPVLRKVITMPGGSNILRKKDPVSLLHLLPRYDTANVDILVVFKKLVAEQKTRMYGMYYSVFPAFYAYAPEQLVFDAYLESLEKDPSHMFIEHMKVYCLHPDERIITSLVEFGIPTIKYAEENIFFFLDWLKANREDLYRQAKELIITKGLIQVLWSNAKNYDREKFVKFSSHFM